MRAEEERGATGRDRWAEALTWHVALRGADNKHLTFALRREWRVWYADPQNRRIFDSASRLLADRDRYRGRRRPAKSELEKDQYDFSAPITEWRSARARNQACKRRSSLTRRWWWLPGGLGAVASAVILALSPMGFGAGNNRAAAAIYQTNVAGIKEIELRDGSSITLGGRTRLGVQFSARRRAVRLIEGEAWFRIAHDPNWPFVVAAGDGTITAIGTAFLVTRQSDRVVVTVTDGTVAVSARPPVWPPLRLVQRFSMRAAQPAIAVRRGEELDFSDNGTLRAVRHADTRAATAWMHGRLIFDDQPLRYVAETINRYSSRRIAVSPSAGALRFSGIIFPNDIEDWLQSLEVIFPITVQEQGGSVAIEMQRSASTPEESP